MRVAGHAIDSNIQKASIIVKINLLFEIIKVKFS